MELMGERDASSFSIEFALLAQIFADIEEQKTISSTRNSSAMSAKSNERRQTRERPSDVNTPPTFEDLAPLLPNVETLNTLARDRVQCNARFGEYMRFNWMLAQNLSHALRTYHLSMLQWVILNVIAVKDGISARAIGEATDKTQNDVRSVCYVLARAGWIVEDASKSPIIYRVTAKADEVLPLPAGMSDVLLASIHRATLPN